MSRAKVDQRRLARGVALQILYELDMNPREDTDILHFKDLGALLNDDVRLLAYMTLLAHHEDGDQAKDDNEIDQTPDLEKKILPLASQERALGLVKGVIENRGQLDAMIHRYAPEWEVNQIAVIDRNILRIAVYEFGISLETKVEVAINEAVELAKVFGSDSTPGFVNGVLGSLARRYEELMDEMDDEEDDADYEDDENEKGI